MAERNVKYFKDLVKDQKGQLLEKARLWEMELSSETIPEEALGEIRTVIGCTELLLAQKVKQFEGLITDCALKRGEKEVTCEDLQGFYDMIYFQIEKIHKSYSDLEALKKNNWEAKSVSPVSKPKIKKLLPKTNVQPNSSTKARALAARQRLAEAKARSKKNIADQKENVLIVVESKRITSEISKTVSPTVKSKKDVPEVSKTEGVNRGKSKKNKISAKDAVKTKSGNVSPRKFKKLGERTPSSIVTRSAARKALLEQSNIKSM